MKTLLNEVTFIEIFSNRHLVMQKQSYDYGYGYGDDDDDDDRRRRHILIVKFYISDFAL